MKSENNANMSEIIIGYFFCTLLFIYRQKTGKEWSSEVLAVILLIDTVSALKLCKAFKLKRKKYTIKAIFNGFLFISVIAIRLWI